MGADKTSEFRARVKAAKVKAGGRIDKAAGRTNQHGIDATTRDANTRIVERTREVRGHITQLKEYLSESRRDYLGFGCFLRPAETAMTFAERDGFDLEAQAFVVTCQNALKLLEAEMASLAIDGRLDVGATRASHEPHSSTKPDGLSGSLSGHHAGCRDSLALYLDQVIAAHDGMVGLRQSREALAARLGSPAKLSSRAERRFLAAIGAADGAADGTAAGATGAAVSAADPMEDPSEDDGDAARDEDGGIDRSPQTSPTPAVPKAGGLRRRGGGGAPKGDAGLGGWAKELLGSDGGGVCSRMRQNPAKMSGEVPGGHGPPTGEQIDLFKEESNQRSLAAEVQRAETKVMEVSKLQGDLMSELIKQSGKLDDIEQDSAEAQLNIEKGNEQIKEAMAASNDLRWGVVFFLLMCAFSLMYIELTQ